MESEETKLNEAIKAYLKENLNVCVESDEAYDYGSTHTVIRVKLYLADEVISEDSLYF